MSVLNGVISAPVEISDIQSAIGATAGGDLGQLCTHVNINMWAKFKPVKCDGTDIIDTTDQLSGSVWNENYSHPWWVYCWNAMNNPIKYGIQPRTGSALNSLYSAYYAQGVEWQYYRPTGGQFPYRQLDFLQYNHYASHPLGSISAPSSLILASSADGGWSVDVSILRNQDDALPISQRDHVTPEDILKAQWGVSTIYFGFALIDKADGKAKIWTTGNRYIGSGKGGLDYGHTYYVMPFYSNVSFEQDFSQSFNPGNPSIPGTAQLATIPYIDLPQLVIPNGSVTHDDARFSVRGKLQNGMLTVTAVINAEPLVVTGGTIRFNGGTYPTVTIYVCKADTIVGTGNPDPNDVLDTYSYTNISVVGGSKTTLTRNFNILADKCRIFIYAGNGDPNDPTLMARASGDAMVSEGTIVPTA